MAKAVPFRLADVPRLRSGRCGRAVAGVRFAMPLVGILAVLFTAAGCSSAKRCSKNVACEAGSVCVDTYCEPDAGASGGGAGGGGGMGGGMATCLTPCKAWEVCAGSQCANALVRLEWANPDGGAVVGANAPVTLSVRAVSTDGGNLYIDGGVPFTASFAPFAGLLTGSTLYSAMVTTPNADGPVQAAAGWSGGPDASIEFYVDKVGPTLVAIAPTRPAYGGNTGDFYPTDPDSPQAIRRDEVVAVQVVSSAGDVNFASVRLDITGIDGSTVVTGGTVCDAGVFCKSFTVDLVDVPFNAIRGAVQFAPVGTDVFANPSAGTPASAAVTRWRWAKQVDAVGAVKGTPAVTREGRVLLGTTGASGATFAVAADGGVVWRNPLGSQEAGPAMGFNATDAGVVFVQVANNGGTIYSLNVADGVVVNSCAAVAATPSFSSRGALAIVANGTNAVGAVSLQYVTIAIGHNAAVAAPYGSPSCIRAATNVSPILFPGNMVTNGSKIIYPDDQGYLQRLTYGGPGNLVASSTFPTSGLGSGTVSGLSLVDMLGLKVGGGGGSGAMSGKLFVVAESSGSMEGDTGAPQNPVSAPVVAFGNAYIALFRQASTLQARRYVNPLAAGWTQANGLMWQGAQNGIGPVAPSPVLGEGGLAYFVSKDSRLLVATQLKLTQEYEGPISTSLNLGNLTASPTIDCNRFRPSIAKTGTLYVASEGGYLVSIIIDSRGLDTTAPWPKYQRDQLNTGNLTTQITGCP